MRRHLRGTFTISIYPLLAAAGVIAMSGCAAVPAINMASGLFKPTQPAQQTAQPGTPAPNMLSSLAQQFGITLPGQTAAPASDASTATPAPTTTAAK